MYLHSRSSSTRGEQITLKLRCYFTNVLNNVSDWYFANSHNHSCCDDQDNDVKTKTKTQKPSQDRLEARQCLENIMSSSHCRPPLILTLRDSVTLYLELFTRKNSPGRRANVNLCAKFDDFNSYQLIMRTESQTHTLTRGNSPFWLRRDEKKISKLKLLAVYTNYCPLFFKFSLCLYVNPWRKRKFVKVNLLVIALVFIAPQHAYACKARYCYGKSVRTSVRLSVTLWYCI